MMLESLLLAKYREIQGSMEGCIHADSQGLWWTYEILPLDWGSEWGKMSHEPS